MLKTSFGVFLILLLLTQFLAIGQPIDLHQRSFGLGPTNLYLQHPAYLGSEGFAILEVGNLTNSGAFSKVRTYYAFGGIALSKREKSAHGHLGAFLYNESVGDFIQRPRGYLNYAWHIKLNSTFTLGAGARFGFVNYTFPSSDVSPGGSATAPDGSIGLWLQSERTRLGLSSLQILNSKIIPIDLTFRYPRSYNLFASCKIPLSVSSSLTPYTQVNIKPTQINSDYDVGVLLNLNDYIFFGPNFRNQRSVSFIFMVNNIVLTKMGYFNIKFAYNHPIISRTRIEIQSVEICLGMLFKKQEDE